MSADMESKLPQIQQIRRMGRVRGVSGLSWYRSPRTWLLIVALVWALLPVTLQLISRFSRFKSSGGARNTLSTKVNTYIANSYLTKGPTWPAGVWWESKKQKDWQGCVARASSTSNAVKAPKGFLKVKCNGGINQQRQQICDAVALAHYLEAVLIVPQLTKSLVWKDDDPFAKIFDLDFFIEELRKDVLVVREEDLPRVATFRAPYEVDPPVQSTLDWWDANTRIKLAAGLIVRPISMTDRLHFENVPDKIQQLRCRACFHALRWNKSVLNWGDTLVRRMMKNANHLHSQGYVALHLRLEKDSLSHSGCRLKQPADGRDDLDEFSKKVWKHQFTAGTNSEQKRAEGHCPLTAAEAGRFLEGLGYPFSTPIYIAGGRPSSGSGLEKLQKKYPNLFTKDSLLNDHEMGKFLGHPSMLAALDYLACRNATVFVSTHGGNMADFLTGERTYLGKGLSISPHKQFLTRLFDQYEDRSWNLRKVSEAIRSHHADALQLQTRKFRDPSLKAMSLYRMPLPACVCKKGYPLGKGHPKVEGVDHSKANSAKEDEDR
uniref:O-fucosyltransferase family protein n=1 Tax=Pyramimonas obovata TaxID=1411642 RepID=A0A7S0QW86_9CHLO|mmetsp:Transcript_14703/g.31523  ORF Transcript_14703/g.31523 Transcript_14703/m.31523 type:complete len:547 (+) Transcript_14703:830-2470(+)|eukprot:CAMPEP_0118958038 /NCGR_PEP_ID=MMETSP1169-20130426/62418_1 /TAXON_ID=36882 /ORGANISM="Pyramimonas obovata, Strain CCMP722" /LENGTH=546 /DNA_ID=CAMNT_0006906145 /DNA_START=1585 /DNA_END=3225 /DNA_ORIENTATION=+